MNLQHYAYSAFNIDIVVWMIQALGLCLLTWAFTYCPHGDLKCQQELVEEIDLYMYHCSAGWMSVT